MMSTPRFLPRRIRSHLVLASWLLAACGSAGGDGGGGGGAPSGGGAITGPPTTARITMSDASASIVVGAQKTLSATAIATDGSTRAATFTWTTSSASIATVTQQGVVTGVAPGLATVTATFEGKSGSTAVTVVAQSTAPAADYTDISIGTWFTCAHTRANGARCWGLNDGGQLGDSTQTNRSTPVQVVTKQEFVRVAVNAGTSCGLTPGGDVYCWGGLQPGPGVASSSTPALVAPGLRFVDLVVGRSEVCALTGSGQAYCWGVNEAGGVGDGTRTRRMVPTPVNGLLSFVQLASGDGFTCGAYLDRRGVLLGQERSRPDWRQHEHDAARAHGGAWQPRLHHDLRRDRLCMRAHERRRGVVLGPRWKTQAGTGTVPRLGSPLEDRPRSRN